MRRALLTLTALALAPGLASAEPKRTAADYVRGQIQRCWNIPADAIDAGPVTIRFRLDRAGKVAGKPEVVKTPQGKKGQALAQSGIRAVQKCSPFPELPKLASYDSWREITATFDPTNFGD